MEIIFAGFILGFVGSLHCIGMCGPIALNLPLNGNSFSERLTGGILYNLGRTFMYGIIGAIFGFIGKGFLILGIQQWVSIIMGILLIISVLAPIFFKKIRFKQFNLFTGFVRSSIQKLFNMRSYKGLFLIGMLNSLLPCGLVYVAIIGAIATGNIYYGSLYLILFGLGTLPLMLSISMIGNTITLKARNILNKLIPYVVIFIGVLFILRGLCLGIPYISPSKLKLETTLQIKQSEVNQDSLQNQGDCCHPK
ncbi:MAG: sulfite exporter TauE/SafE family protein [Bacteroidetes bacterium]|nr:sulfite exporter TauE/SafE family protein [Bacteroidota bacterium]